ncbi:MAG: GreA/GreB family elongation factor [Novosphingobium sp.]
MSVAFRRDGDDEHLEPKFEIPIPPGPNRVTRRGRALIETRIADLLERMSVAQDEAALAPLKRDLRYWQTRQVTAEVMAVPDGSRVEFGTTVRFLLRGLPRSLAIVGDDEAYPAAGLVSFSAPLSRALMGGEAGDLLPFGGEDDAIEILEITPITEA